MTATIEELGRQPVQVSPPAGRDVRYEPEMEELRDEMGRLNDPQSEIPVDWNKTDALARKILSEQSKDMMAACYLAVSLIHEAGIPGMREGFSLVRALSENFWDTMFPVLKRIRGRKHAIDWLVEKSTSWLRKHDIPEQDKAVVEAVGEDIDALDRFLAEHMDDPPYLNDLLNMVRMLPVRQEEAKGDTEEEKKSAEEEVGVSEEKRSVPAPSTDDRPVTAVPTAVPDTPESARKSLEKAMQSIRQTAGYFFSQNDYSPLAIRLSRIAAWSCVESLPPSVDGKTRIPPPPMQLMESLQGNIDSQSWQALLQMAEARVGDFLFWFDLSFYSATALDHLRQQSALDELERQTAGYLFRLKGVEKLCFSDGTKFVSEKAKQWLKGVIVRQSGTEGSGAFSDASGSGSVADAIAKTMDKARELNSSGRFVESLVLLQQELDTSRSKRDELFRRSALASFLVETGKQNAAVPHFQKILREIDDFRIELLDPDMALELLAGIHSGLLAQEGKEYGEQAKMVLERIAGISPVKAMQIEGLAFL